MEQEPNNHHETNYRTAKHSRINFTTRSVMFSSTAQVIIMLLHLLSCILAFTATTITTTTAGYHSSQSSPGTFSDEQISFPKRNCDDYIMYSRRNTGMARSSNNEEENISSPQSIHDANAIDKYSDEYIDTESLLGLEDDEGKLSKKEIAVSASIVLPFHADIAFSAFADLRRQPTWSSWLHSVEYLDEEDGNQEEVRVIDGVTLRETKWVMQWKRAFRFSWKSRVTNIIRPSLIEWESTSGLRNMGKIQFTEQDFDLNSEGSGDGERTGAATEMVLTMKFIAPRIVASIMKRSDVISTFMEDKMLMPTLINFREIVMEKDLGMKLEECVKDDQST
jgi:uncharacterized membrane protein